MTHDEMIKVIAAHRDSRTIQFRFYIDGIDGGEWRESRVAPKWNFGSVEYREKPEPPHCYGHINAGGDIRSVVWGTQEGAETARMNLPASSSVVKLILAPDEEQPF